MKFKINILQIRILIIFVYLIFAGIQICRYGIVTDLEAAKYIEAARELSLGNFQFVLANYKAFISYIFFLLPATLLGQVELSVIPQIILMIIASNEIFRFIKYEFNNVRLAIVAMGVFLFNFFIQSWTTTLFSESFFIPVSTIMITYALRQEGKLKSLLIVIPLSVIVIFARPQGILFVIPALFYVLKKFNVSSKILLNILFYLFVLTAFTYIMIHKVNCEFVYRPIAESSIICGFPKAKCVDLNRYGNCNILNAHMFLIDKYGFIQDMKLFGQKAISLFTFTRPYYSKWHNLIVGLNYILLVFSVIPIFNKKNHLSVYFLYQIICLNIVLTGITYNEWHGRYLAALTPILIILSAIGMAGIKKSRHETYRDIFE